MWRTFFLIGLFMASSPLQALTPAGESAYQTLVKADTFSDAHVGIVGSTPDTVKALRVLVKETDSAEAFQKLLAQAPLAGELYALCGLYYADYPAFQKAVQPYRKDRRTVNTLMGCMGGMETVAGIVETSSPKVVRLSGPQETLDQYLKSHPTARESGYNVDIIGGGWPESLVRSR